MTADPAPLLAIRGLRAAYGKIEALKGVDLDINPGEIVVVDVDQIGVRIGDDVGAVLVVAHRSVAPVPTRDGAGRAGPAVVVVRRELRSPGLRQPLALTDPRVEEGEQHEAQGEHERGDRQPDEAHRGAAAHREGDEPADDEGGSEARGRRDDRGEAIRMLGDQAEVDRIFGRTEQAAPLPKGMSAETADLVLTALTGQTEEMSAQECADAIGVSRVSARRYLEHLAAIGAVHRSPRYGGPGRPETVYTLVSAGGRPAR